MEDNKADLFLIGEAIALAQIDAELHVVHDGQQAVQFIESADKAGDSAVCPDLVVMDLNLPKKSGTEVLQHLRNSQVCKNSLVLVVTSSDSETDREAVRSLGFNAYFRKPSDYAGFMKVGVIVKDLLDFGIRE